MVYVGVCIRINHTCKYQPLPITKAHVWGFRWELGCSDGESGEGGGAEPGPEEVGVKGLRVERICCPRLCLTWSYPPFPWILIFLLLCVVWIKGPSGCSVFLAGAAVDNHRMQWFSLQRGVSEHPPWSVSLWSWAAASSRLDIVLPRPSVTGGK